ncbi:MAG: hypothetical protein ABJA02_05415 [Acidobacteriota bacterium]
MIKFSAALMAAVITLGTLACQKEGSVNNAVANTSITANANSNSNDAKTAASPTTATSEIHSAGSLATPIDAYKTAYDLRKKKDIEGLKKIMSKDILDFFAEMGKPDKKSVDDMLKEMCDDPQAATAEARNEKIDGDHATIEYLDAKGGWSTMDLEKVGSEWKLSFPKEDKSAANSPKKP